MFSTSPGHSHLAADYVYLKIELLKQYRKTTDIQIMFVIYIMLFNGRCFRLQLQCAKHLWAIRRWQHMDTSPKAKQAIRSKGISTKDVTYDDPGMLS
jgi:hypothetical protein